MKTRMSQVKALAERLQISERQMDDFVWTFCTTLIINMADEYHFNKTRAEISNLNF